MTRFQRAAVLCDLVDQMRLNGSWCGETHLQKSVYLLQELFKTPLEYQFVLYKHGPFSFDFRDELSALTAECFLTLQVQTPPYGPRFALADAAQRVKDRFRSTSEKYKKQIGFVATKLGGKGVADLERLATALFVTVTSDPNTSGPQRAEQLTQLKPHVPIPAAQEAISEMDIITAEAASLRN